MTDHNNKVSVHVAWTPFQLTEQAIAQESATEALADEMLRIRQDLAIVHDTQQKILERIAEMNARINDLEMIS